MKTRAAIGSFVLLLALGLTACGSESGPTEVPAGDGGVETTTTVDATGSVPEGTGTTEIAPEPGECIPSEPASDDCVNYVEPDEATTSTAGVTPEPGECIPSEPASDDCVNYVEPDEATTSTAGVTPEPGECIPSGPDTDDCVNYVEPDDND